MLSNKPTSKQKNKPKQKHLLVTGACVNDNIATVCYLAVITSLVGIHFMCIIKYVSDFCTTAW